MTKIPALPAQTTPNDNDLLAVEDDNSFSTKKIKISDHHKSIKCDTIAESTTANGVEIDSVRLKDGLIVGGSGTGVANSSLSTTAGDIGGAWKNYTPTWTNLTVGNGTLQFAKYGRIGKSVFWLVSFALGSTSAVTGDVSVSLPVSPGSGFTTSVPVALATYIDTNGNLYPGYVGAFGSLYTHRTDGTYAVRALVTTAVPFTWGNGDVIVLQGSYESE